MNGPSCSKFQAERSTIKTNQAERCGSFGRLFGSKSRQTHQKFAPLAPAVRTVQKSAKAARCCACCAKGAVMPEAPCVVSRSSALLASLAIRGRDLTWMRAIDVWEDVGRSFDVKNDVILSFLFPSHASLKKSWTALAWKYMIHVICLFYLQTSVVLLRGLDVVVFKSPGIEAKAWASFAEKPSISSTPPSPAPMQQVFMTHHDSSYI